jgi:hypothetical protein
MKGIDTFIVLFLIGFVVSCASTKTPEFSTTNEVNINELKQLGRKELIRLAAEEVRRLGDDDFNPGNFDRIRVMAGKDSIYVSFSMSIKYVPQNSIYKYDATVDFSGPDRYSEFQVMPISIVSSPKSNPKNYISKKEVGFFSPTEDSRKAIDFVLNAMKRHTKCGYYTKKKWPWNYEMIIRDKNDHYEIEEILPSVIGYYSIKKISGKIYDENHMNLIKNAPSIKLEGFEAKFEEITE